ncbi:bHLH family protein [Cinnamomum micranthum f. kanehirae]|uniref:BHLH family protein n=1 Tax=Cinnamomum micranthum f. kanehirae TaxID=337451 RepID=A0A443N6I3_9MAGN|nr:bHLH family protein [Cinnamomum micranthum f. kanehirae]
MDEVCKELMEVKAEMEKLKADYRVKKELSESLRIAHSEQLVKIQEAKMEIEKQAQELNAKSEEITLSKQLCENLKLNLHEKESILKHLSSTNDQIRISSNEKLQKMEKETKELISALEEAKAKLEDQDQKISAYIMEIEGLNGLLSTSQKKCSEAEEKAKASKELRQRDDLLLKLEQESRKIEERLKWKNEQFNHLEEAHQKVQNQFGESKKEWESEKSTLVDEICSLQTNFESQVRVSESLRSKLQMCNQALAHEESRRKLLEIQLSESKTSYENVVAEFQGAQSIIESLTAKRDEEISALRDLMVTKEIHFKEMEYLRVRLEQENEELCGSLKELQEAQISQAGAPSSVMKLRQKLRSLEQAHKDCSSILKAKEVECSSLAERVEKDLVECQFKLTLKDKQIGELQTELEGCRSSMMRLKSQNEEISTTLRVLKSEFSEAHSEIKNSKVEMDLYNEQMEERISLLMEQLEKKNIALAKAQEDLEQERDMKASLMRRVESSDSKEEQYFLMQKEIERYEEMIKESLRYQEQLKAQASLKESALREDLRKVSDALDQANSELAEKSRERSKIEFELQSWKSVVKRMEETKQDTETQLTSYCDENQRLQREMEAAILSKMENDEAFKLERELLLQKGFEKNKMVDELLRQTALLEQESKRKETEAASLLEEVEKSTEEKDRKIDVLKQQLVLVEEESTRREAEAIIHAKTEAQKIFDRERERGLEKGNRSCHICNMRRRNSDKERERLLCVAEEKDSRLNELQQQILQLEEDLRRETEAAISATVEAEKAFNKDKDNFLLIAAEKDQLINDHQHRILLLEQELVNMECTKQSEISNICEAWEKLVTDWMMAKLDIHDQSLYVTEQEEELDGLKQKLESKENSLSESKKRLEQLKAKLELRQLEKEKEMDLFEEVKAERKSLLKVNARLLAERDGLMDQMIKFYDRIGGFSIEDMELMKSFEKIVQKFETAKECQGDGLFASSEDKNICSPLKKKAELDFDNRSPLKVLNN